MRAASAAIFRRFPLCFRSEQTVVSNLRRGKFCFGDAPTLADICLVPQLANARRFGCDLSSFPALLPIGTDGSFESETRKILLRRRADLGRHLSGAAARQCAPLRLRSFVVSRSASDRNRR